MTQGEMTTVDDGVDGLAVLANDATVRVTLHSQTTRSGKAYLCASHKTCVHAICNPEMPNRIV